MYVNLKLHFHFLFERKNESNRVYKGYLILFYGTRGGSTCKFTLHPPTARINRSKIERHQPTRLIAKTREKHAKNTRKRAKTREKTRKTREKHANRPAIKRKTRKAPDKNSENNRKTRNSCHFYKNHILIPYLFLLRLHVILTPSEHRAGIIASILNDNASHHDCCRCPNHYSLP